MSRTNKNTTDNAPKERRASNNALECININKKFAFNKALKDVSLTVKKGHIAGLFGPEGAGKTTLAKIICNLCPSYLPEYPFVNSKQRVGDLVEMYRSFYDDFNVNRAVSSFKRIEVSLNDKFCYLSRSSIQMVETVLVMCRKTKLYVLDEPIAAVEPKSRDFIIKTIISNCDNGSGVLITSAIASQLEKILDEVHIIHKGEIKLSATPDELMNDYGKTVSGFYREAFRC